MYEYNENDHKVYKCKNWNTNRKYFCITSVKVSYPDEFNKGSAEYAVSHLQYSWKCLVR